MHECDYLCEENTVSRKTLTLNLDVSLTCSLSLNFPGVNKLNVSVNTVHWHDGQMHALTMYV